MTPESQIQPFTTQMDVVWMLGPSTKNNDWELRHSMRSFHQHYLAEATPWIIGRIPSWIDRAQVNCIPWPNPAKHKDGNLMNCALRLALEPALSDAFILCSDDHFLLRDSAPQDFKWWHNGPINPRDVESKSGWRQQLGRTRKTLTDQGFTAYEFEGHIPYPIHKTWCANILRFPWWEGRNTVFSTILNCAGVPADRLNSQRVRGRIHNRGMSSAVVLRKFSENQFLTLNNGSEKNAVVRAQFKSRFGSPAPWELDQPAYCEAFVSSIIQNHQDDSDSE